MENLRLCKSTQEEINIVYSDSYILKAIKNDNSPITPIINPFVEYISCFNNNEFLGCFIKISQSDIEIEGHSLLLKKGIKYSRKLLKLFMNLCFSENIERMTTYISEDLPAVINYCLKANWKIEGIKRNSFCRNGNLKNTVIMGIIRKEITWEV